MNRRVTKQEVVNSLAEARFESMDAQFDAMQKQNISRNRIMLIVIGVNLLICFVMILKMVGR